jgi:hypothetical protein
VGTPPGGTLFICPVCLWEDDQENLDRPRERIGGPNLVSLMEAYENFAAFGAAEQKDLAHVRPPLPAEIPGE